MKMKKMLKIGFLFVVLASFAYAEQEGAYRLAAGYFSIDDVQGAVQAAVDNYRDDPQAQTPYRELYEKVNAVTSSLPLGFGTQFTSDLTAPQAQLLTNILGNQQYTAMKGNNIDNTGVAYQVYQSGKWAETTAQSIQSTVQQPEQAQPTTGGAFNVGSASPGERTYYETHIDETTGGSAVSVCT